jgi:hypothetical protein
MPDTSTRNALDLPLGSDDGITFYTGLHTNFETIDAAISKCNFSAGALDPTVDNDETQGYAVGSLWIGTSSIWICRDASDGVAVWAQLWPVAGAGDLKADGTVPLTANWDVGSFEVQALKFKSDQSTGTAPLTVASTTKVTNLNADQLDGSHDTDFVKVSGLTADWDAGSFQVKALKFESDQTTGTAPIAVTSTTKCANLNADQLDGYHDTDFVKIAELISDGIYRQVIINGGFQINQRSISPYTSSTVPANSDDTYLHDMWTLLSDGNDIVDVSVESTIIPSGGASSAKFEVETQNKKFGYIQFIENKDAVKYAGKSASLQFKAYTVTGKAIRNVRAAVLSWSGTADTLTSDVVNAWGNEGTNPTLVANWTAENTATDCVLVADTWTTFEIENIAIDTASMANLAVFIWVDDTDASVDDLLYIAQVQLNQGSVCLPYTIRPYATDLFMCQRFLNFLGSGANSGWEVFGIGGASSTTLAQITLPNQQMCRIPDPSKIGNLVVGGQAVTAIAMLSMTVAQLTVSSGLTANTYALCSGNNDVTARIICSAVL